MQVLHPDGRSAGRPQGRPSYCPVAHARRRRPARRRPGDPLRGRPQQRQPPARPRPPPRAGLAPRRRRHPPRSRRAGRPPPFRPGRPRRAGEPWAAARRGRRRHPAGPPGPRAQPPVPLAAVLEGRPRLVPRPGGARADRVLRRLPADRHPAAQRLRRRPDLDRLLQRRHERDGPLRRPGPHHRRERPDPAARQGRDRRGRGPHLLREPRRLAGRSRPGRVGPGQRRLRRRWLDDHPAVRQELLPHLRPDVLAQGQGSHHRAEDRPAADQGRDPHRVPQHHLLRPRCVRHPGGGSGVLRQERRRPHGRGGRAAGRHRPEPERLGPGEEPGEGDRAVRVRARRHGARADPVRGSAGRDGGADGSSSGRSRPTPAPTATCWRWCAASCSRTARSPRPTWTPAACGSPRRSAATPRPRRSRR